MENKKPLSPRYQIMVKLMKDYFGRGKAEYAEKIIRENPNRRWKYNQLYQETEKRYRRTEQGKKEMERMIRELNQKDITTLVA